MTKYPHFLELESLLETDATALNWFRDAYPGEMMRWEVIRKRMGGRCPLSRGVLKVLCMYEKDNGTLRQALEDQTWPMD